MKRVLLVVALAIVAVLPATPASAKEKTATRYGTVSVPCAVPKPKGQDVCGVRIAIPGRADFTLVTDVEADVDVYFYTKDNTPTSEFTHPTCDGESGDLSPDAVYGVIVLVDRGCGSPASAAFTFTYRTLPGARCPEVAPNCNPFWGKLAVYIILGILFGPLIVLVLVGAYRRVRRRRVAV